MGRLRLRRQPSGRSAGSLVLRCTSAAGFLLCPVEGEMTASLSKKAIGESHRPRGTSSRSRSPRAETPISLRPASVSRGSRSASILLSRKFASYRPRPRPRSHPPTSMAAPHMAWRDNRPVGSTCPAAQSVLPERRDRGSLRSVGRSKGWQGTRFWRNRKPRSAFSRFALVHRTDLKGQQKGRFDPFTKPPADVWCLRNPAVHGSVFEPHDTAPPRSVPTRMQ